MKTYLAIEERERIQKKQQQHEGSELKIQRQQMQFECSFVYIKYYSYPPKYDGFIA